MKPAERSHADWKKLLADQSLPLAWVDLDALDRNTTALLQRAGSLPIRIATKSVRTRWLLEYLLSASPRLQGLMTWSAAETVWLAEQGFDDLLLAYPSTEREALHQLAHQVRQGKTIRVMTDSAAHATLLATHPAATHATLLATHTTAAHTAHLCERRGTGEHGGHTGAAQT